VQQRCSAARRTRDNMQMLEHISLPFQLRSQVYSGLLV
jgi:hypothetical protein